MIDCGLKTIPASCKILIGEFKVSTPFILNAVVQRTRGQLVSTASTAFQIQDIEAQSLTTGGLIVIKFYEQTVFTGYVKRISVAPSFRCNGEVIVRIQAEDAMFRLSDQRLTRRQKLSGLGPLAFVTSLKRREKFDSGTRTPTNYYNITTGASPVDFQVKSGNVKDMNAITDITNTRGKEHPITKFSAQFGSTAGGGGGGGGFILHDHTSLDTSGPHAGGPAFGTYGIK